MGFPLKTSTIKEGKICKYCKFVNIVFYPKDKLKPRGRYRICTLTGKKQWWNSSCNKFEKDIEAVKLIKLEKDFQKWKNEIIKKGKIKRIHMTKQELKSSGFSDEEIDSMKKRFYI